jgi:hypothetical protein
MGRISPDLQLLADEWSPIVMSLLNRLGQEVWPVRKRRRSLLAKAETVIPYSVEGPAQQDDALIWSLFHTSRPSAFDDRGRLQPGQREYWLITLESGFFTFEGAETQNNIPATVDAFTQAVSKAQQSGPKAEAFYGNKGPLSHRASIGK